MLQLTSSAASENRTEGLSALRRFDEHFDTLGHGVPLLHLGDPHACSFAGKRPEAKNDDTLGAADALAVGEDIGERELEFGAFFERRVFVRRSAAARQAP